MVPFETTLLHRVSFSITFLSTSPAIISDNPLHFPSDTSSSKDEDKASYHSSQEDMSSLPSDLDLT
jgi:hypothetical protein